MTFHVVKINAQQTLSSESVHVLSSDIRKYDSQLFIEMELDLSDLKLQSNRSMSIVPILEAEGYNKVLPEVLVNGRTKHIMHLRGNQKSSDRILFTEVRRRNNTRQVVNYKTSVFFQNWMRRSILALHLNSCGCEGGSEKNFKLAKLNLADIDMKESNAYSWIPSVAYVTPKIEAIKTRTKRGTAYLDFPVNKSIINPEYRRNPIELDKIKQTIDVVQNDTNVYITNIMIHGYASPEGNYANNKRLAEERAEALRKYVSSLYQFNNQIFTVNSTPEDWEGLLRRLDALDLKGKDEIRSIINQNIDSDIKEQKLKQLNAGRTYQYILQECFPALRHSDYTVNYIVRGFSVAEVKEVIGKHPQQLSLQEMFLLSQTYEKGSNEFNEVFDVAVRMFPNDPIANLNASSIALSKRDVSTAKKYLEKSDKNLPETENNMGVLAVLEGRIKEAEELFAKASVAGVIQAKKNLKELEKEQKTNK